LGVALCLVACQPVPAQTPWQITEFKAEEIVPRLLLAASKIRDPEYQKAALRIGMAERDVNNLQLQAELHR
jgi:hypothetical protein